MSPDGGPDPRKGPDPEQDREFIREENLLRHLFSETHPHLEAKASESMPRDLDALFEKTECDQSENGGIEAVLQDLFSRDLRDGSQSGSPASLDAATASELDCRIAGASPVLKSPLVLKSPVVLKSPPAKTPILTGLAAAALLGMLYLWGEGHLSTDPDGNRPLLVLVDVERPLDTSMDPSAISLAAAGFIDFVEGSTLPASSERDDRTKPKKASKRKGE